MKTTKIRLTKNTVGVSIIALLTMQGCTHQQVYEVIQENRYQACETKPIPTQAACREQYSRSYEDYKLERDRILADSNDTI
ncbi:MAG: hypothetical protein AB8B95_03135 [Pseudohongiellaceae bacterium]